MLALCLMLSSTYNAKNYANILGWCIISKFVYQVIPLKFWTQTARYQSMRCTCYLNGYDTGDELGIMYHVLFFQYIDTTMPHYNLTTLGRCYVL